VHVLVGLHPKSSVPVPLSFMIRLAVTSQGAADETKTDTMEAWLSWCRAQGIPPSRITFFDGDTASFNGLAQSLAAALRSSGDKRAGLLQLLERAAAGATVAEVAAARKLVAAINSTAPGYPVPTMAELHAAYPTVATAVRDGGSGGVASDPQASMSQTAAAAYVAGASSGSSAGGLPSPTAREALVRRDVEWRASKHYGRSTWCALCAGRHTRRHYFSPSSSSLHCNSRRAVAKCRR
jgi:hypothetical protein